MRRCQYRIINKTRFIISIILLTIVFILLFSLLTNTYKSFAMNEVEYIEVKIKSGDTIWNIAKEYRQENQDIRELVYIIIKVNNIKNSIIYEGQKIKIPSQ
ncbi:MAG: LysM peptidoglycan-binding domain-containing protein [Bacillota bacterium]|nr:LysM peptidoglycan-binding domain-containing protein [Bacillota bacterium]